MRLWQWNPKVDYQIIIQWPVCQQVFKMPTLSSLVVSEFVLMTTSDAISDDKIWQYDDSRLSLKLHIRSSLQWRHNGRDNVSNHQPQDCLVNCLFRRRWKKTSKLHVTGGIHRWPVNSPHKWPVTRKMLPFDDVIMFCYTNRVIFITTSTTIKFFTLKYIAMCGYVKPSCKYTTHLTLFVMHQGIWSKDTETFSTIPFQICIQCSQMFWSLL